MNDYETTNVKYGKLMANHSANICQHKVNYENSRKRCAMRSKLKIETPQRRQCCRSGVFIANLRHIFTTFQMFLLLI